MNQIHHIHDSAWEAAQNVALQVIDGGLLHHDNPFSPHIPHHLAADMPDLTGRLPLTLPWDKPELIDPERHYVWLLDSTAFRPSSADLEALAAIRNAAGHVDDEESSENISVATSAWQAELVAAFFIRDAGVDKSRVIADLCKKLDVDGNGPSAKIIGKRLASFTDTVLPLHTVRISIGPEWHRILGPSSSSGISAATRTFPSQFTGDSSIPVAFPGAESASQFLPGTVTFAEPSGWGLISDIDDTIKITLTEEPFGILKSTFLDTPQPVAGMPELYKHIISALSNPAVFYLSASPYNLYPFLRHFRHEHYPPGPIILREASWQNLGGLISSLTQDVQEYKVNRIKKIHACFPKRGFVCIGDSTQKDPESYGEIARTYPGWIKAIFIRKVSGVSEVTDPDQEKKNSTARFEEAFKGLDSAMWHVFTDPGELPGWIDDIAQRGL